MAEIADYWPAVLAFLGARAAAKWLGVGGSALLLGASPRQAGSTGLLLLPMAGLAIGLVNTTLNLFPEKGAVIGSIVLAAVALLETVGPPIAARALRWSGDKLNENGAKRPSGGATSSVPSSTASDAPQAPFQPPAAPGA